VAAARSAELTRTLLGRTGFIGSCVRPGEKKPDACADASAAAAAGERAVPGGKGSGWRRNVRAAGVGMFSSSSAEGGEARPLNPWSALSGVSLALVLVTLAVAVACCGEEVTNGAGGAGGVGLSASANDTDTGSSGAGIGERCA